MRFEKSQIKSISRALLIFILSINCTFVLGQTKKPIAYWQSTYMGSYQGEDNVNLEYRMGAYYFVQFDELDNETIVQLYDTIDGSMHQQFLYDYNADGLRTEERYYSYFEEPGGLSGITTFEYNKKGKLIKEQYCDSIGIGCGQEKIYLYDSKGNIVSELHIQINGDTTYRIEYTNIYTAKSLLKAEKKTYSLPYDSESDTYTLNAWQLMEHHVLEYEDGNLKCESDVLHDWQRCSTFKDGIEIGKETHYNATGSHSIMDYISELDQFGNVILRGFVDESGSGQIVVRQYVYE